MPRIWASPLLPRWQKVLVSLQIGQPLAFLVGATCMVLSFPFIAGAAVAGETLGAVAILTSALGFAGPIAFLAAAGASTSLRRTLIEVFTALFLTTGLLLSNARAGLEALIGYRSAFVRTPKGMVAKPSRTPFWPNGLLELTTGLGLLSFVLVEEPVAVFYLSMVIGGLLGVGTLQFLDGRLLSKERGIGT
jgi:hypothetical protein